MEKKPNGRITTAQFYEALYEFSQNTDANFRALREEMRLHREINHKPPPSNAKVGGIAGVVGVLVAVLASVARAMGLG